MDNDRIDESTLIIDAAGRHHQPAGRDARIVSLVPSITELLFDLGLGAHVVGRTAFCVHPAGRVKRVRSVGGTKQVNRDKLHALAPTHVIVNVDETPRRLAEELAEQGYAVVVTHPIEVSDNLALFRLLGALFDRAAQAEALCRRFEQAYDGAVATAAALPALRVLYLIWKEPWMTVSRDTYISRMLALVRWQTMPEVAEVRYPTIPLTDADLEKVDLVLFSSEPFPFTVSHVAAFQDAHPAHRDSCLLIDGQMVSWYGSRAIAGLDYLTRLAAADRVVTP